METMNGNVGVQAVIEQENTLVTEEVTSKSEEMTEKKKAPVNALDLLLGGDINKIELPTKKVEITRLSKVYGAPFYVTLQAMTTNTYEELQDMAVTIRGKDVDIDTNLLHIFAVIEGTLDENGKPLFKNKELLKKTGAITPKELVKKILLSGEIVSLYGEISDISGFNDDSIKEIKN